MAVGQDRALQQPNFQTLMQTGQQQLAGFRQEVHSQLQIQAQSVNSFLTVQRATIQFIRGSCQQLSRARADVRRLQMYTSLPEEQWTPAVYAHLQALVTSDQVGTSPPLLLH